MRIKIQIGYPLSTLPNAHGFQFRGVEENGDLLSCRVDVDEQGFHYAVCDNTGEKVFHRLRGWMQWLPNQKQRKRLTDEQQYMERKPLTNDEIVKIERSLRQFYKRLSFHKITQAIERAHGIGGKE